MPGHLFRFGLQPAERAHVRVRTAGLRRAEAAARTVLTDRNNAAARRCLRDRTRQPARSRADGLARADLRDAKLQPSARGRLRAAAPFRAQFMIQDSE